ncbi:MAG: uracil-DNA glycosylase family protein [Lapillicoccus sp.]
MAEFCPGYPAPFDALVVDYPGGDVYPSADFRTEWGPIFHRGRLDGSARLLVLGQDPATHETISRRILVGEAGQRVQGLLAKLGVDRSYAMVNTFLYSVYGQGGGNRHKDDEAIAAYRNAWLDALLVDTDVTAVVSLGQLADTAYQAWEATRPEAAARLHHAALRHPTYPESGSRAGNKTLAETTAILLADWNAHLPELRNHVMPDGMSQDGLYGTGWQGGDLVRIPEADLPPGSPDWWFDLAAWASRTGADVQTKRATISVVVPRRARLWPVLPPPSTPPDPEG